MIKSTRVQFLCLFLISFLLSNISYAQQHSDSSIMRGHFEIDTTISGVVNHINVNFELSPMPISASVDFRINTANNMIFNIDLKNSAGTLISSWTPTSISNSYSHTFNTSMLSAGTYLLDIRKYHESTVIHTITFLKL